jgi:hypothetical protein
MLNDLSMTYHSKHCVKKGTLISKILPSGTISRGGSPGAGARGGSSGTDICNADFVSPNEVRRYCKA